MGQYLGERTIDPISQFRRDIGLRLTVVARLLRNDFDRRVAETSLTRSKWTVIAVVARRPGASQRALAEALEISEVSAGRLVDRLCTEGLLERRPREDDRRAFSIYLTKKATPVLEKLAHLAKAAEEQVFKSLTVEQLTVLSETLDILAANLSVSAEMNCEQKERAGA